MSNARGVSLNNFGSNRSPPPQQQREADNVQRSQQPQPNINIDDLFRGVPNQPPAQPAPSNNNPITQRVGSASTTPVSSVTANSGGSNLPSSDNRNQLLSTLIGHVGPQQSQQPYTQSTINSDTSPNSDIRGRNLLEQMMSGPNTSTTNATQSISPYSSPPQPSITANVKQQQAPESAPSPPAQPLFGFVSPFDALADTTSPSAAAAGSGKRKPVPGQQAPNQGQSSSEESSSFLKTSVSNPAHTQRMSVENLMDTLTLGSPSHGPHQVNTTQHNQAKPAITSNKDAPRREDPPSPKPGFSSLTQPAQIPYSSVPVHDSPVPTTTRQAQDIMNQPAREWKTLDSKPKSSIKEKRTSVQASQQQTITFDVSQPQENIQAPAESSLSTPIALVKVEPTFLPGTTIGATSWIAYAMTRGRVRVISRASGDRTLLQLPAAFPASTSVVDMAVFGDRLAGVTSDGGLVVWELPHVIMDDCVGKLLLCVVPPPGQEALRSVRWHPRSPDTVAVASESHIYLLNINEAARTFGGAPVAQSDLMQVGPVINLSAPLVAFAFDVPNLAIATISEDSTLELWEISNHLPFWSARVPGDSIPSSIDFLEGGIVIGRKNGTIFQLLPVMSDVVLSTLKFIDTQNKDDRDMFGHIAYDSRIQTLWIANSRRESLIGVKIAFETISQGDAQVRTGRFDQVVEFVGPKPSIHFVILTGDSDPHGDEAHAACIASKVPPGPLAMVAFSVHAQGVDQIIIRKEWFDNASINSVSKLPNSTNPFQPTPTRPSQPTQFSSEQLAIVSGSEDIRSRTPTQEDAELDAVKEESRVIGQTRATKGKGVAFKDKEEPPKEKAAKVQESTNSADGNPWSKDLRKMEDNLHTRVGRTIGKELEKQQQRLEEARAADQSAEVARQEKIIRLISTELTKNTTRVVEVAVKSEVQQSVLPALESVTRAEVKKALAVHIPQGLADTMKSALPAEIERLFLRPDFSNHIARTISAAIVPTIEHVMKETISKTLIPSLKQDSSNMQQEISRELHTEVTSMRNDFSSWQSETLRNQEATNRELEQSIRSLQDQLKYITHGPPNGPSIAPHLMQHRASPVMTGGGTNHSHLPSHIRGAGLTGSNFPPQQAGYSQPPVIGASWYPSSSHAPLMQQGMTAPQGAPQSNTQSSVASETPKEDWDETYLAVLGSQEPRQLRDLLARSHPDVIMPLDGPSPLSQAVVLTLIHRLSAAVGETSPVEEAFKASLFWLQRSANCLNPNDPLISPYVGRVLPTVQTMLNTTKSRLSLLPGGPPLVEASRVISEVQETVARKSGV